MSKPIKDMYNDYKLAEKAVNYAELNLSEEEFDKALDESCEKLDLLVNEVVKVAHGTLREFDVRRMIINPKYSGRFENIVNAMA